MNFKTSKCLITMLFCIAITTTFGNTTNKKNDGLSTPSSTTTCILCPDPVNNCEEKTTFNSTIYTKCDHGEIICKPCTTGWIKKANSFPNCPMCRESISVPEGMREKPPKLFFMSAETKEPFFIVQLEQGAEVPLSPQVEKEISGMVSLIAQRTTVPTGAQAATILPYVQKIPLPKELQVEDSQSALETIAIRGAAEGESSEEEESEEEDEILDTLLELGENDDVELGDEILQTLMEHALQEVPMGLDAYLEGIQGEEEDDDEDDDAANSADDATVNRGHIRRREDFSDNAEDATPRRVRQRRNEPEVHEEEESDGTSDDDSSNEPENAVEVTLVNVNDKLVLYMKYEDLERGAAILRASEARRAEMERVNMEANDRNAADQGTI